MVRYNQARGDQTTKRSSAGRRSLVPLGLRNQRVAGFVTVGQNQPARAARTLASRPQVDLATEGLGADQGTRTGPSVPRREGSVV